MAVYITVGAKTTHSGTIITGSTHTIYNSVPVSHKGEKVICNKYKKVVIIIGDLPYIVDGSFFRARGLTSCGSKLITI